MLRITEKEFNTIHNDYKSVYSSDDIHGTNLNGRKTFIKWIEGKGTVLLIEGIDFEIIKSNV